MTLMARSDDEKDRLTEEQIKTRKLWVNQQAKKLKIIV